MDARLRILQRQAQSSGTAEDWARYAGALQKVLAGEDVDEPIIIWIAEINYHRFIGDYIDHYCFATETEAKGHLMNHLADEIGEIIKDPDIDDEWYSQYQKWLQLTQDGDYNAAWELYWANTTGLVECEHNQRVTYYSCAIGRCSPKHPSPAHCISSGPW